MVIQLSSSVALLLVSASISAALATYAWQRRYAASVWLSLLMLAVTGWTLTYVLELAAPGLSAKVLWARTQYPFIVFLPVAWLAFVCRYTGRGGWLTLRSLALLALVPLATLALAWTNDYHGLIWQDISLDTTVRPPQATYEHGAFFWVHALYSYALLLTGTVLLYYVVLTSPRLFRGQVIALLAVGLAPWMGNALYLTDANPFHPLDPTPFAFTLSGLALSWAVSRHRLLDILPVAHSSVIQSMKDPVIILDQHGRVADINPAAQSILGLAYADVAGQPAEAALSGRSHLVELCRTRQELHTELALEGQEGTHFYELDVSLVRGSDGQVRARCVVLRDVTERRRAQVLLERTNDELEARVQERTAELCEANERLQHQAQELARSNAELEQFAYVVSHDLQEPLRTVSSFASLLARHLDRRLDQQAESYIQRITTAASRMHGMILDLLEYSRVGRNMASLSPTDCQAIVRQEIENLQSAVSASGAAVRHDDLPVVQGDPSLLGQVFRNLIGNAIKFRGDAPPRVHISACRDGAEWVFSVQDNGIGIDPAFAERIFGMFQRLHSRDEYEGSGMGLAICKKAVERMGGRIWVESSPGKGSTFYFTVRAADSGPPEPSKAYPRAVAMESYPHPNPIGRGSSPSPLGG